MKQHRLLELDALRGIAAMTVVLYHYFFRFNEVYGHEGLPYAWAEAGHYGVQLFFMVSGFVIYWTLGRIATPMDFVVSRASRLYPAYWVAILITFTVVHLTELPGREVNVVQAIVNFSMLQEFVQVPSVDGVYWTLTIELIFYFWMFLFYLIKRLTWVETWLSTMVLLSLGQTLGWYDVHSAISKLCLLPYAAFFLSGICLYKVANGNATPFTYGFLVLSLGSTFPGVPLFDWGLFVLIHLAFYLAISGKLSVLAKRPFIFLGTISYSLYLIHQNIGYSIIRAAYAFDLPPLVGVVVAIICSIALAAAINKWVEVPVMAWIRERWKNWSRARVSKRSEASPESA